MIAYIFLYLILIIIISYLLGFLQFSSEKFNTHFIEYVNTEFRGMNLLGENNDAHFAGESPSTCKMVCERNPECKAYSFYQPGQRCYIFGSGNIVPGRPGFVSGKRLSV